MIYKQHGQLLFFISKLIKLNLKNLKLILVKKKLKKWQ